MSTRTLTSTFVRFLFGAALAISSAACGGELLRTGRSPVYLFVTQVEAGAEGGTLAATLFSDTRGPDGVGVFNDNVAVTLQAELKNPTVAAAAVNRVTLTRYRVNFRRADGRNTPGVDVPFSIEGALSSTVVVGSESTVTFVIVRHTMKLEPPLSNLSALDSGQRLVSGQGFITTVAEITLWGRDQNGNEVTTTASLDVHFGNFN